MPHQFFVHRVTFTCLASSVLLAGCASPRTEPVGPVHSREQVAAMARDHEVELSALRAEMATTRIAGAKKEAELLELRGLVAQLRQENTDTHQKLLELRQAGEFRQTDLNALKAERDQLLQAKHDQSLKELKDGLLILTRQLEEVRQDIGPNALRGVENVAKASAIKPTARARPDILPESRVLPSTFHALPTSESAVTAVAVSAAQSTAVVTRIRVQPGDSLSSLARVHHTSVAAIQQLNHLNSHTIAIGQELSLPIGSGPSSERER